MSTERGRVLVTGASGFIGSHLAESLLASGKEVRLFLRYSSLPVEQLLPEALRACEAVRGDIRDSAALLRAMEGMDTVYHLAALVGIPYSYECPAEVFSVNAAGTAAVLDAALKCDVSRLVLTSTSEVYGSAQTVPIREDHPLNAQSPYAASKVAADQLGLSYHRSFGLPVAILRPFNTYGPRQSARAVIPTVIQQALTGKEILLGTTSSTRDFSYVQDTVDAFIAAGSSPEAVGCITQTGSGREVSIGDLVQMVGRILARDLMIVSRDERLRPQASEVQRLICDATLAKERLGWSSRVSLEEGLARTIDWLRDHPQHLGKGYQR